MQFTASDGPATGGTWSISVGQVLGITMDSKTGIMSGAPSKAGTYPLTIAVNYGVAIATKAYSLTVNAAVQPFGVSPGSLQLSEATGNFAAPQNLVVSSVASDEAAFSLVVDDGKGGLPPNWLNVSPKGGVTPSVLRVSRTSVVLQPGTYNARIRISLLTTAAGLPSTDIPVTLTVTNPPPSLSAAPKLLRFQTRVNAPTTADQVVLLRNDGGGPAIPISVASVNKSSWITRVTASAQQIVPGSPVSITVSVNSQGLDVGTYRDVVRVTTSLAAPFNQFDIPVTLTVQGAGAYMNLSGNGVRFTTFQGNTGSPSQQIVVRDDGDPGSSVNWAAQVIRGSDFLTLSTPRGVSTSTNATSFGISLTAAATTTADPKYALIQVTDPQALHSPQYVAIVIDVAAAGLAPVPLPDPPGLFFTATAGASSPNPQQITVNTTSTTAVKYSVSDSTIDGGFWLAPRPDSTTTTLSNPGHIAVTVSPGSLNPGIYTGTVNIGFGSAVRGVLVTLVVKAQGTVASFAGGTRAATCTPNAVAIAQSGIVDNFAVPAGWPVALSVQVSDNCGSRLPAASVVASFNSGDAPIPLAGDNQGSYAATWQPGIVIPNLAIRLDAASGSLTPAQMTLVGEVDNNATPSPALAAGGFLNNLYPQVGAPLAPGTVTQVYGTNLAAGTDQPSTVPLPTTFRGVEALIGGVDAPFFYVSKGQLVIQVPSELAPKRTYSALIAANNQYSIPQDVDLVAVTPGTVAFGDGRLVAQHGDFSLVDATNPAKSGEALTIYLVGMGGTNPSVQSGTPAPSTLASVPSQVTVTVASQSAKILFAGLTPGGVGLYQINFIVPAGLLSGDLPVVISQDGVLANSTTLTVSN